MNETYLSALNKDAGEKRERDIKKKVQEREKEREKREREKKRQRFFSLSRVFPFSFVGRMCE